MLWCGNWEHFRKIEVLQRIIQSLHKKWSFPLRETSFFVQWILFVHLLIYCILFNQYSNNKDIMQTFYHVNYHSIYEISMSRPSKWFYVECFCLFVCFLLFCGASKSLFLSVLSFWGYIFVLYFSINPLQLGVDFLYTPWKHQKTFSFSDVFRECRKATPGCNGLMAYSFTTITVKYVKYL